VKVEFKFCLPRLQQDAVAPSEPAAVWGLDHVVPVGFESLAISWAALQPSLAIPFGTGDGCARCDVRRPTHHDGGEKAAALSITGRMCTSGLQLHADFRINLKIPSLLSQDGAHRTECAQMRVARG
jgi:hypothetical protein